MKKTYIIPKVKTFALRTHKMMATSPGLNDKETTSKDVLGNSNSMDDQESKPWYK